MSFHGGEPIDCGGDILDCGVSPQRLLALLRRRFLDAGGTLLEGTAFKAATGELSCGAGKVCWRAAGQSMLAGSAAALRHSRLTRRHASSCALGLLFCSV